MVALAVEDMFLAGWLFYLLDVILFVLLLVLWRCRWRDYMLLYRIYRGSCAGNEEKGSGLKPVPGNTSVFSVRDRMQPLRFSVVIPCCDQARSLESNLPALLEQNASRYEVIVVVDQTSTDDTMEVLERMEKQYPHLRHTFVPATARYVGRRKLAVTLGVRAARSPWVLLTCADALPASANWLGRMSAAMSEEVDFVLGCANYEDDGSAMAGRAIYERQRKMVRDMRAAYGGKAIGGDDANWAVRKECFMTNKGYADSLTVPFGEADSLLDALSRKGRVALEVHPDSCVLQALPSDAILRADRICLREVQSHLGRRARMFLWREGTASLSVYLFVLISLVYVGLRWAATAWVGEYGWFELGADACACLSVCASLWISFVCRRRLSVAVGVRHFCLFAILFYAVFLPVAGCGVKFRRWRRRHDFVRR